MITFLWIRDNGFTHSYSIFSLKTWLWITWITNFKNVLRTSVYKFWHLVPASNKVLSAGSTSPVVSCGVWVSSASTVLLVLFSLEIIKHKHGWFIKSVPSKRFSVTLCYIWTQCWRPINSCDFEAKSAWSDLWPDLISDLIWSLTWSDLWPDLISDLFICVVRPIERAHWRLLPIEPANFLLSARLT